MSKPRRKIASHLRLVVPADPDDLQPLILRDPSARAEFARLSQALVDIVIEMNDLIDGDPDLESDDVIEDDDGI